MLNPWLFLTLVLLGMVVANDIDAALADREDAILIARHAIVASGALVRPDGITLTQKAAAIAQLQERGVLVRISA